MAAGQDSQHDFAPAWLKLPSQDALVSSKFFVGKPIDILLTVTSPHAGYK